MGVDAWELMEAKASEIRSRKWEKEKAIEEKLKLIREYNRKHPIVPPEEIVKTDEPPLQQEIITSADYVLSYLFPQKAKGKKIDV